jgi:hypothetical protein
MHFKSIQLTTIITIYSEEQLTYVAYSFFQSSWIGGNDKIPLKKFILYWFFLSC